MVYLCSVNGTASGVFHANRSWAWPLPACGLSPQKWSAQNFALALHELATNAAKYGALSNHTGRVRINWSVLKPNGYLQFMFRWQERGGPSVAPPTGKGFAARFLNR